MTVGYKHHRSTDGRTWRSNDGWRGSEQLGFDECWWAGPDSAALVWIWSTAGITFDVQVGCGFVGATVAGVSSLVALGRLLDDQHAFFAVRLEENVLGWKYFFSILEPFDLSGSFAQFTGQYHFVLFDGGVVVKFHCEVQIALCKKAHNKTSNIHNKWQYGTSKTEKKIPKASSC